MVPAPDREPPDWAQWQLDGLARLHAARSCIGAVLIGDWPPDPEVAAGIARLIDSAAERFRRADACREAA